ncbi:MAG: cbb3-type cytochrome oxidase assembly protein CcoS [Bacteroidota bacterium]|nr:cbb3-type cytochrome oxidase assembly protein CcoS [Bacteroidota bacterium]
MSVLFILIGASILIAFCFLVAFIWSVRSGQYEDDYTPSVRMLFENPTISEKPIQESSNTKNTFCKTYKNTTPQQSKFKK